VIDFSQVKVFRSSKIYDLSQFDCGDKDINEFLKQDALLYQEKKLSTTILFTFNDQVIGFFSTAADSIKLKLTEKEEHDISHKPISEFPAMKISRIGRDINYRNKKIGEIILRWAIGYILKCSEMTAVRFVTVDAYPNRVEWYKMFGFVPNLDDRYTKKSHHISMRYDLLNQEVI